MVVPPIEQIRVGVGPALVYSEGTTGQKTALGGRVDGPGHTTLDLDLRSFV